MPRRATAAAARAITAINPHAGAGAPVPPTLHPFRRGDGLCSVDAIGPVAVVLAGGVGVEGDVHDPVSPAGQ